MIRRVDTDSEGIACGAKGTDSTRRREDLAKCAKHIVGKEIFPSFYHPVRVVVCAVARSFPALTDVVFPAHSDEARPSQRRESVPVAVVLRVGLVGGTDPEVRDRPSSAAGSTSGTGSRRMRKECTWFVERTAGTS
jgi:hypothetical protein